VLGEVSRRGGFSQLINIVTFQLLFALLLS
jgi:hypothetical protein